MNKIRSNIIFFLNKKISHCRNNSTRDKKVDFVQNLLGHIKLTHSAISLSYYNMI
jgi:hypothetical protein